MNIMEKAEKVKKITEEINSLEKQVSKIEFIMKLRKPLVMRGVETTRIWWVFYGTKKYEVEVTDEDLEILVNRKKIKINGLREDLEALMNSEP